MVDKKGIKETQELLSFILEIIKSLNKSLSGGFSIFDTVNFVTPALLAPDAMKNITEVPAELKDLDEQELQQLADIVLKQFESLDSKKEAIIKKSIVVAIKIVDLYLTIKE